jgi:multidrug resistance efflux pump
VATADRATASKVAFEIATSASGELEARRKVEIRNQLDQESTVVRIVPEGTRVKAGEVLIQLNVEEIQLKVDEERLKVESARAESQVAQNTYEIQAKENESKLRQAQLKVELAELALRQWAQGDTIKKARDLELDADKATLELQRLADVYIRAQELNAEGFLSKDQMDKDEVAYIEAISKFKTAQLAQEVYQLYERLKDQKKFESDVAQSNEELNKAELNSKSELASKLAESNNKREQLAGLERKLAKLTKQRDDATIRAERDGLVVYGTSVERSMWGGRGGGGDSTLAIGSQVFPNQLLMILPDTSEMVAAVRVHESLASRIKPQQEANVRIEAVGGGTVRGKVESIGVMAESGGWRDPNLREYTVKIALETGGAVNFKPAMRCEARVILDSVPETLTIPLQSVFNEAGVQYVFAPWGPKFIRKPVRLGRRSDTLAEIVGGLSEGDTVLVREPAPGEVLAGPFAKQMLVDAGYSVDDGGKVVNANGGNDARTAPGETVAGPKPKGPSETKPDQGTSDAKLAEKTTSLEEAKPAPAVKPAAEPAAKAGDAAEKKPAR